MNCYESAASVRLLPCTEQEFEVLKAELQAEGQPYDPAAITDLEADDNPHGFDVAYVLDDVDAEGKPTSGMLLFSEEESCAPFLLPKVFVEHVGRILSGLERPYWTIGIAKISSRTVAGAYGGYYAEITCDGRVRFQNYLELDWTSMTPTWKTAQLELQGVVFDVWAIAVRRLDDRWDAVSEEDQGAMEAITSLAFTHGADLDEESFIRQDDKLWAVGMMPAAHQYRNRGL